MKSVHRFVILAALISTWTAGCATAPSVHRLYGGSSRSIEDVARLYVPAPIDVFSIGEHKTRDISTSLVRGDLEFRLLPGQYEIVARFSDIIDQGDEDYIVVKAEPVRFAFQAEAGKAYRIVHDEAAAEEFSDVINLWVVEDEGLPVSSYVEQSAEPVGTTRSSLPAVSAGEETGPDEVDLSNVQLLKGIWRHASEAEKRTFRDWINQP